MVVLVLKDSWIVGHHRIKITAAAVAGCRVHASVVGGESVTMSALQ